MMTMAPCLSSLNLIVLLLMVVTTECKECEIREPVTAVQNSAVTLRCPVSSPQAGITQLYWEVVYGDTVQPINQCPPSCPPAGNNNRTQLCERVRTVQDPATGTGTLTISPVNSQDALWYRCTVQAGSVKNCSELKLIVKDEPPVQRHTRDCEKKDPYEAVVNSTFTFSSGPHPNATQIIWGINEGDQTVLITRCPSPCTFKRTRRPLCERVKTVKDAASGQSSLTISSVEITDSSWLLFIVNTSSCYTFKLNVKDNISQTTKGGSHTTPRPPELSENFSVVVAVTSTVFACVFVALVVALVKMGLCVRKQKHEDKPKTELESQYAAYAEIVDNDYPYSIVHHIPEGMCTFKDQ